MWEALGSSNQTYLDGLASDLTDLSDVLSLVGDLDRAADLAARALALRRTRLDGRHEFHAISGMALVELRRGELDAAKTLYRDAAMAAASEGRSIDAAGALVSVGDVIRRQGRWSEAQAVLEDALRRLDRSGDRQMFANAIACLGAVAAEQRDEERAVELLSHAIEESRITGISLDVVDRKEIDSILELCRTRLGEEVYSASHIAGAAAADSDEL